MKVEFDDTLFQVNILGETDEIRDCIKDITNILHKGYRQKSTMPDQIRTDLGKLESLADPKGFVFHSNERIFYDRHSLKYMPPKSAQNPPLIAQHYDIMKRIWR